MENEKRLHRCCFTGHRPEKLSLSENEVKHLLVDRSSLVIAVWNGQPSETKNTIDYADRKDVKVVNVLDTTMQ